MHFCVKKISAFRIFDPKMNGKLLKNATVIPFKSCDCNSKNIIEGLNIAKKVRTRITVFVGGLSYLANDGRDCDTSLNSIQSHVGKYHSITYEMH
jgi:hypothetical protein